jgi:hypothetical protein
MEFFNKLLKGKDERIAGLNKDATEAKQGIATAQAESAKATERAAQANLELAKFKAPRSLTAEQQGRITEKLKGFAGKQFDVALLAEPEPQDLLVRIEDAITAAGWSQTNWKGEGGNIVFMRKNRPDAGLVSVSGVIIQMHEKRAGESIVAARALAAALKAEGILAEAEPGTGTANTNTSAIHILVGRKP